MQIFSTFEHSNFLELAISELELRGIQKDYIYAVPLDNRVEERKLFDTLHHADGISTIDIAMALSTAFSVIGASIGFKLKWGPIYWGLIGVFLGFLIGFFIKLFILKETRKKRRELRGKYSEVILIVDCKDSKAELVERILWDNLAIGVAKVKQNPS
ncbi:hypothetical protein [Bacillus sp. T3]|uniref:hypothetical protein n=1 Tax=Bacillus sp. T3 TaxID=467262 RepID=UPI002982A94A|nr:hypothetical protein [Bacillus sp. T3]